MFLFYQEFTGYWNLSRLDFLSNKINKKIFIYRERGFNTFVLRPHCGEVGLCLLNKNFKKKNNFSLFAPKGRSRSTFGLWILDVRKHFPRSITSKSSGTSIPVLFVPDRYCHVTIVEQFVVFELSPESSTRIFGTWPMCFA